MAKKQKPASSVGVPTSLEFFSHLKWLDNRPLLDTIEQYRRDIFTKALDTFDANGSPKYNFVVAGRAKKNFKSTDLILAGLYKFLIQDCYQGNDALIVANDEEQAGSDLDILKKLAAKNPDLTAEIEVLQKELRRRDGRGSYRILPGRDTAGMHGKSASFIGYDEIWNQKTYDQLEGLAPDPTRRDTLQWVCSYDTLYSQPGVPLFDLKQIGFAGSDPRMLFSWYSGEKCTDSDFADLPPERRANPSMGSWAEGMAYVEQQRRRLPSHKFRRLHLNLPGAPNGAFFDQGVIMAATVTGRKVLPYRPGVKYYAGLDMSGGSSDDAVLCVCHAEDGRAVMDLIVRQAGPTPFDPRAAMARFANFLHSYNCTSAFSDAYSGLTFVYDAERYGIRLQTSNRSASDEYENLEVHLNSSSVELLDAPELTEQLIGLVVRGSKITHESSAHDDHATAAAIALNSCLEAQQGSGYCITSVPTMGPRDLSMYHHGLF
jgi:hypothetical protein